MYAHVAGTRWLTPHLARISLSGGDLDSFEMADATDAYLNLAFPPEGAPYGPVFDPAAVRDSHPRDVWPRRRRYTVREWDAVTHTLTIDVVVHGSAGAGGLWASRAEPGSILVFEGPGGGYRPDPSADWHLMAGDESALPAIGASLEAVPTDAEVIVRIVCDGPEHEVELPSPGRLDLAWLHRSGPDHADLLHRSIQALAFPTGRVHAFVHGEAEEIRAVRRHLLVDRGMDRRDLSCSPYWRRTMTDEAWREVKRDFVAQMDADVA
jgi:NADPH-dependent ferric siderophore reductase